MNKKDVNKIQPGIYRIHWKAGGESLASVGIQGNGNKWLAPLNWVAPTTDLDPWKKVKSVEVVILYKDYQDEKEVRQAFPIHNKFNTQVAEDFAKMMDTESPVKSIDLLETVKKSKPLSWWKRLLNKLGVKHAG